MLNQLLDHAVATGLLADNPCRSVTAGTSRRKRRVQPFTRDELDRLAGCLDAPHDLFVQVMAFTRLRWGEMAVPSLSTSREAGSPVELKGP